MLLPNPKDMEQWGEDSATSYLAATIYYYVHHAILGKSNMTNTAKAFHVTLTGLQHCINGRKYISGSKAKK